MIVSAYNEREVIAAKLQNTLALDYPRNLLEIVVISDCSDDGTDQIVNSFKPQGVRLIRMKQRFGKTTGLNLGVPQTSGSILVFSDSNAIYRPDAVRYLVEHFIDPNVGYVVGNARYTENKSSSAYSEGLYWKLESWIKLNESRFHCVVGGDGAIYAIRRELYSPLRPTDINDFLNPLQIVEKGYRGVFEPRAICYEDAAGSFSQEFHRKTRIVSRSFNALLRARGVLNPFKNLRHWFMLISHKVLRWLAPLFILIFLVASLALSGSLFYRTILILQAIFCCLAIVGSVVSLHRSTPKIFLLPYYFVLVNLASLVGLFKFLKGDLAASWVTVRDENDRNIT